MFNNSYMNRAFREALKAYRKGEVPVGAVIVHNPSRQVIAARHNLCEGAGNPIFHAEILAINDAFKVIHSLDDFKKSKHKYLQDCSIYSTLEPCAMCASAIAHSKISHIYYGASDSKGGAIENNCEFFKTQSCFFTPQIYPGMNKKKSRFLIQKFFNEKLRN